MVTFSLMNNGRNGRPLRVTMVAQRDHRYPCVTFTTRPSLPLRNIHNATIVK